MDLKREGAVATPGMPYSVQSNSNISLVILSSEILMQIVSDICRMMFLATFMFVMSQSSTTLQVSQSMEFSAGQSFQRI